MAVNLVKPDPSADDRVGSVEAAPPPRIRCVARPELAPYHAFDEHGVVAVKTGTKVIIHCAATLIRRGWGIAVVHMRKARAKSAKTAPATDATKAKGSKPATAKKKGGKKPPPKARSGTADLVVGSLLVAGMGVAFVTRTLIPAAIRLAGDAASWVAEHPVIALRGTGIVVIIYVVIAWTVGGVVGPGEDRKEEDHGAADEEATETDTPKDRDDAQTDGAAPTDSDGGKRQPGPSPAAFLHLLHDLVEEHSEGDKRTPGLHWPQVVAGLSSRYPGGGSSGGWSAADCRALCKAAAVPTSPGTRARGEGACKGVSTGVRTTDLPPRPSSPSPGPSQEGPPGLGVAVVSAGQIQQQGQQQQQQQGASNSGESAADWIVQDEENPAHWLVQR
ncbi:hypothetical protein ACIPXV_02865 [Streptomyces libani]|uniref:hypothetical protein n=1 Tax=Streptomyces nigrescens TaxID=1920 RepID=UPI0038280AB3